MFDPLIYGKAGLDRIVGMEANGSNLEIFRLKKDGEIETIFKPFKYWALSNEQLNRSGWVRMKGNLHYKWGRQFNSKEEFLKFRRFNKNKEIYSVYDNRESAMLKDGYVYYLNLKPSDLPILSFDLETTGLNPDLPDSKVLLISNTFRKNGTSTKKLFAYDEFESQGAMIQAWSEWVYELNPSIITGHNVVQFDFNYLLHIADRESVQLNLGRDKRQVFQETYESKFRIDGSRDLHYKKIRCYGREVIDTMFLAYRHDAAVKKYDSYGLKPIIKTEGLEKENRVFYDSSQIRFKYTDPKEWEIIKQYCVDDSDDSLMLFDLMAPAQFFLTQSVPRSFQQVTESATGALINGILVRAYLQDKHSIPKATETTPFEGGISFAIPGIYRNVLKWDLKSAYPSQILRFKLYDKEKDPNGYFYKIVKFFTEQRFVYKKNAKETGDPKWIAMDSSAKIFINSSYGTLSTPGLQFNSPVNAAKITEETRKVINMALIWASGKDKDEWVKLFKEKTE